MIIETTRQLVIKTLELMKDFEPFVQHSIFEIYLGHALLKNVVLEYITNLASLKFIQEVYSFKKLKIKYPKSASSLKWKTLNNCN